MSLISVLEAKRSKVRGGVDFQPLEFIVKSEADEKHCQKVPELPADSLSSDVDVQPVQHTQVSSLKPGES